METDKETNVVTRTRVRKENKDKKKKNTTAVTASKPSSVHGGLLYGSVTAFCMVADVAGYIAVAIITFLCDITRTKTQCNYRETSLCFISVYTISVPCTVVTIKNRVLITQQ